MEFAHFAFFVALLVHSGRANVFSDWVRHFASNGGECKVASRKVTIKSVAKPDYYIVNEGPDDEDVFSIEYNDFYKVDLEGDEHVWTEDQHKNCFVTYRSEKGRYLGVADQEAVDEEPDRSAKSKLPIRVIRNVSGLLKPKHDYYGVYWQKDQLKDKDTNVLDTFMLWNQKYWGAAQLIVSDWAAVIGRGAAVYRLYITNNSADAIVEKENQFKIELFKSAVTTASPVAQPIKKDCTEIMGMFAQGDTEKLLKNWTSDYVSGTIERMGIAKSRFDPLTKENVISCGCDGPTWSICIMAFLKAAGGFYPVSANPVIDAAAKEKWEKEGISTHIRINVQCDASGRSLKDYSPRVAIFADGFYCFAFSRKGLDSKTVCDPPTCEKECKAIGWADGECEAGASKPNCHCKVQFTPSEPTVAPAIHDCSKKLKLFERTDVEDLARKWTSPYLTGAPEKLGNADSRFDTVTKENHVSCACDEPKGDICIMAFLKADGEFYPVSALPIGDGETPKIEFTVQCDAAGRSLKNMPTRIALSADGFYCFAFRRKALDSEPVCYPPTCRKECKAFGWADGKCEVAENSYCHCNVQ